MITIIASGIMKKNVFQCFLGDNQLFCSTVQKNKDFHKVRLDIDYQNSNNEYESRIRYRQPLQNSKLVFGENGVFMIFDNLQSAISKGQFAVWYKDDELIGSGVID